MGQIECCGARGDQGVDYADDGSSSVSLSAIDNFKQRLNDESNVSNDVESSSSDEENDDGFTVKHAIRLRKDGDPGAKLDMELLYGRRNSFLDDQDSGQNFLSQSPTNRKHAQLYRKAASLGNALNAQTLEEENLMQINMKNTDNQNLNATPDKLINLKSSPSATTVKKKKKGNENFLRNNQKKSKKRGGNRVKNQLVVL